MSQVVTSGDTIKIWETPEYKCLHEWFSSDPNSDCRYSSNSWSVDHGCVASGVKGKEKVVLTYFKNEKYSSQEIQIQGISSPQVIRFPRTTQKNLFISSDNSVHIYDLSRQKVSKSFRLKSRVSSFVLNNCDAYLAAGCDDGSIQLVTVATNQTSLPMLATKCTGQRISAVQYSPCKPSFLGASCESGVLSFWDCNTNKNIFSLSPHVAPAKDLSFSPINANLVLSVGLDKKLVCCDPSSRKSLMTIHCEQPLTCVDFDQDGVTLAVGTSRGKLLVYDLRNSKAPVESFAAHNSSVSSAVFKNKQLARLPSSSSLSSSNSKSKSRLTQQKSVPSLKTVQEEGKENTDPVRRTEEEMKENVKEESQYLMPCSRRESTSSMIFSPLREPEGSPLSQVNGSHSQLRLRENLSTSFSFSPVRELDSTNHSVFSPLQDSTSPVSSLGLGRRTPLSGVATPLMSPLVLTSIREEQDSQQESQQESQQDYQSDCLTESLNIKPTLQPPSPDSDERSSVSSSVSSQTDSVARTNEILSVLTAFPEAGTGHRRPGSTRQDISSAVEKITEKLSSPSMVPGPGPATEMFQRDYISGVVGEAMQEWCDAVEKRLWGLQYGVLRQMQQHQEETMSMLADMTGLSKLKEERDRLLQENSELRKFFGTNP